MRAACSFPFIRCSSVAGDEKMPLPKLTSFASYEEAHSAHDAVVVVCGPDGVPSESALPFQAELLAAAKVDERVGKPGAYLVVAAAAAGGRVVVSGTGPVNRDYDDVRRVGDAAAAAVACAKGAGAKQPVFVFLGVPNEGEYERSVEVALLGALQELYQELQTREAPGGESSEPITSIGFVADASSGAEIARVVTAMEAGRRLARDVGGSDPERMSPKNCADYVKECVSASGVEVDIVDDIEVIKNEYPLAHAVARASLHVPHHFPRIVRLHWKGEGEISKTLMFSGKGIVYDTGGADIKTNGIMAGMHMDKCGAANIAGFVKTVSLLKPKGLEVFAELGFVRNSCGSDAYVADEVITGHAGKRVLVINTDAEGRMVLSDCLSHLREKALKESLPNVRLYTMATLTGHASRSVGQYSATMDNGPARAVRSSFGLQDAGHVWGDPLEVSTLRRDDIAALKPKTAKADILQLGGPRRGHQFAGAFLAAASGVDAHGRESEKPLSYTHLDIAGAAACDGDMKFGKPTGTTIVALAAQHAL